MANLEEQERWLRLEPLFHQAVMLDAVERDAFLDSKCAGDEVLRRELAILLASSDRTLGQLQEPIRQAVDGLTGIAAGQSIGPYRVLRLLGEGGMGRVYLAVRADEQYRQQVAIKMMQAGRMAPYNLLARFRAERQILADLNHPNIARLLDGGITPEGVPYIVMEYVEGVPIHAYCRDHHLPIAERLRIFRDVCSAVDYAHRHLVVHRDLKPANILVTKDGVPKLLDFGIAKMLAQGPISGENAPTQSFERLLTPEYASPEQVLGQPVTTVTDVYSLGSLLYQLLCGTPPFVLDTRNPLEGARLICEVMPQPPSAETAVHPEEAPPDAALVKGDLDRIVLMALRKEPQRRYASAARLSEDVAAWIQGYPIEARAATWTYVTRRYVGRHRWAVTGAVLFVMTLIVFSAAMGYFKRRADHQETIASQQASYLAGMFRAANPEAARGRNITARELLDIGAQRIEHDNATDSEVRAALLYNIGVSYRSLGYYSEAFGIARQAYDIQSKLYGAQSPRAAEALRLLASSYRDAEKFENAEPLFRRLLQIRQTASGPNSIPLEDAYADLGECLYLENQNTEAETMLRAALAIDQQHQSATGFKVRSYLALIIERRDSFPEAAQLLSESVEIARRYEGVDSPNYAISLHNLGSAQIDAGNLAQAEATLREVLKIRIKVLGNDHPDTAYTLNNLAFVLLEKGDWASAMPFATKALEICRKSLGEKHHMTGTTTGNVGRALEAKGNYREADAKYDQALGVLRVSDGPNSLAVSRMLDYKAQLQFDQGHYGEAESLWRQSLDLRRNIDAKSTYVALSLIGMGESRVFQHDAASAVPMLREALELRRIHYAATHPLVIAAKVRLGEALWVANSGEQAESVLRDALHLAETAPYPLFPWQMAEVKSALGACLKSRGRRGEGTQLLADSRAELTNDPRPIFRISADTRYRR
ncbi:MAG TPA: serine/threonine-protein kinase [Terracidiphilus sp.]|jgi:serine/threonine-protein kinase